MGWLISFLCLIGYFVGSKPEAILAAGLFAIAGSIDILANKERRKSDKNGN